MWETVETGHCLMFKSLVERIHESMDNFQQYSECWNRDACIALLEWRAHLILPDKIGKGLWDSDVQKQTSLQWARGGALG